MADLPVSLDHAVIHVSDWERARDFYTRAFPEKVGTGFTSGNASKLRVRAFLRFHETRKCSDVIGAEAIARPNGAYMFRLGEQQLNVHGPGAIGAPVARNPFMPGNSDLCFRWRGPIEAARAHIEAAGVAIELGPVRRFGAQGEGTSLYFRDPDGSLMELNFRDPHGSLGEFTSYDD